MLHSSVPASISCHPHASYSAANNRPHTITAVSVRPIADGLNVGVVSAASATSATHLVRSTLQRTVCPPLTSASVSQSEASACCHDAGARSAACCEWTESALSLAAAATATSPLSTVQDALQLSWPLACAKAAARLTPVLHCLCVRACACGLGCRVAESATCGHELRRRSESAAALITAQSPLVSQLRRTLAARSTPISA